MYAVILSMLAAMSQASALLSRNTCPISNLSPVAIVAAALEWQVDTGIVSSFLNTPSSAEVYQGTNSELEAAVGSPINNRHRRHRVLLLIDDQALLAYNAEINELSHKLVLDEFLAPLGIASVQAANTTLVNDGTFQFVVNGLQAISQTGIADISMISAINQDRCTRVLPAIDEYFAATARELNAGGAGKLPAPVPTIKAIRPTACAAICATSTCAPYVTSPDTCGGQAKKVAT